MTQPTTHTEPGIEPAEPLAQILERTGYRASLAPEYLDGHAPGAQRKAGHASPPSPTYYEQPAIKKPEWKWPVPAYFFLGGLASGAYIVAALADLGPSPELGPLVRAGRYLQFAALLPCPALLIADLGRPERWYHMLRVFRPRSMMNQGSWGLTLFGIFSGAAVGTQTLLDLAPRGRLARFLSPPLRGFTLLGILPAAYVGSYTGVLLSATNVPLWAGNRYWMGPLFFTSALAAGLAGTRATAAMLGPASEVVEEGLHRAQTLAEGAEIALVTASTLALGSLARPLKTGPLARTFQIGAIGLGMVAPLLLGKLSRKSGFLRLLHSALVLTGSAVLKFAITEAGKQSADDPHAYFEYTRPKP